MAEVFIGIDMGATHIRICLLDLQGKVILTARQKTAQILSAGLLQGLTEFCQQHLADHQVKSIVIGLPAAISADRGKVLSVPNLAISQQELDNLVPHLRAHFACSVRLERDVNLQMIYDVHFYQLQEKLALGIYLGTGVGFAIWQQGNLFVGANGVAGELGHIPYGDEQAICNCGNPACLETICSGKALKAWFEAQSFDFPIEQIFSRAAQSPFIQQYLHHLAKAVSAVVNLFDPHALILGGGVMDMPDFPLEALQQLMTKYIRKPLPYNNLTILKAEPSSFNGAIGAALYAKQQEK